MPDSQNLFAFAISWEGNFGIILFVTDVHPIPFPDPCTQGPSTHAIFPTPAPSVYQACLYLEKLLLGSCSKPTSLQQHRQAKTSCRWWPAGPRGSPFLISALSYSKESLCKVVPREVTQTLASPSEHSCRRAGGSFIEGRGMSLTLVTH